MTTQRVFNDWKYSKLTFSPNLIGDLNVTRRLAADTAGNYVGKRYIFGNGTLGVADDCFLDLNAKVPSKDDAIPAFCNIFLNGYANESF